MQAFFHGWKRKVGIATLILACAFAVEWVRSPAVQDTFTVSSGLSYRFKLVSVSHRLIFVNLDTPR